MTAQGIEAPTPPWVELRSTAITPAEQQVLLASNASTDPAETWVVALRSHRDLVIADVTRRLISIPEINQNVIRGALDLAWLAAFPQLHRVTGPAIAQAYLNAFHRANQGDVPIKMIYALAEDHARRTGEYFHSTSSDALIQGFNTYVNRQIPAKAALARVLQGYGLTPRQMSGLTSANFETKHKTSIPLNLKAKVKNYIASSIASRLGIFATQEAHNLNEQAQQVAWMWMVNHGKLPATAEKMWVTAKDEKVCGICGPMHRAKVPVGERFILDDGQKLYVPGAHTNCRCTVRLQINTLEVIGKADDFDEGAHPRGGNPANRGQFSRRRGGRETRFAEARPVDPRVEEMLREAQAPERPGLLIPIPEEVPEEEELPEVPELGDVLDRIKAARKPKPSIAEAAGPQPTFSFSDQPAFSFAEEEERQRATAAEQAPSIGETTSLAGPTLGEAGLSLAGQEMVPVRSGGESSFAVPFRAVTDMGPEALPPKPVKRRNVAAPVPLGLPYRALGDLDLIRLIPGTSSPIVDLPTTMPFYSAETSLLSSDFAMDLIDNTVNEVLSEGQNVLTMDDPARPGQTLYANVDESTVSDAVLALAMEDDPESTDDYADLVFENTSTPGNTIVSRQVRFTELANMMGVRKEDLQTTIFQTEQGNYGKVTEDTGSPSPTMLLGGRFVVVDNKLLTANQVKSMGDFKASFTLPIRMITLLPEEVHYIDEDIDPEAGEIVD